MDKLQWAECATKNYSGKRFAKDLVALGLRHRRGHDLRRTMISLARTDGARRDLLNVCTHNPGKGGSAIDLYTSYTWDALCEEVAKLNVSRGRRGDVVKLAHAAITGAVEPGCFTQR